MKTVIQVRNRLSLECQVWFRNQIRNPFDDFYCFLILQDQDTRRQDTGLLITRDKPESKHMMVDRLRKDKTIAENVSNLMNTLAKMPCLTV